MAIRTVTIGSGSGADYVPGWKELTIKKAKYDTYNGNKFIDDAANLNGMTINVLFHKDPKDDKYTRIWREPAPVVMETDKLSYTEKNVSFWKNRAENSLNAFQSSNG